MSNKVMSIAAHHLYLLAPGASPGDVRRFYRDGLGLTEVQTPPSLAQVSVLWFSAGPITFHVGYPAEGVVGNGHTALATDDVETLRRHLAQMGYAVEDETIPMGYPRFFARDPWGNQFEMLSA